LTECHVLLGGCGFIGRHVAVLLARAGHDVVLADRAPPGPVFPADVADRIRWQMFEFASPDWEAVIRPATVIHHYVWTSLPASANANPLGDLTLNVASTLGLLEAMRRQRGKRLVFASSGGTVYGRLQQMPVPETHPFQPITAYGAGKATAELYMHLYRSLHLLDCRVARIANPFGAGQNLVRGQGAATTFLHKALTDQPIVIWGDGEVVRDYIHIADVAAGLTRLAAMADTGADSTFNIGSGEGVSLNGIVAEIERHLGRRPVVQYEPARAFDLPVSVLDISHAGRVLGWRPRLSFTQGMARTLADLAANSALSDLGSCV
jgi:UDP-glucose 4-epimerase